MGLAFTSQAQDISKNALGLRLGGNNGFGSEISFQRALSPTNRLEMDLGWRNRNSGSDYKLTGVYQWVWNIEDRFNWYAGLGGGLASWENNDISGNYLFVAGNIGIEYGFKEIPLLLSLDLRPEIGGNDYNNNNYNSDIALGIRYQF